MPSARWAGCPPLPAAAAAARPAAALHRAPRAPIAAASSPGSQPNIDTPLLDAVVERGGRTGEAPFHVPGHKRGTAVLPGLRAMLGGALRYDLTELAGGMG